jgi:hypothetical protein
MGIEIVEYSEDGQRQRKVMEDKKNTSIHYIQLGTYSLGHHDLTWELDFIDEKLKVTLKLYSTSLQTKILDRNNPSTVFKSAWGYGQLDIELRTLFDNKELVINGSVYLGKGFDPEKHIKYDNVIIMSW